MLRRTTARLGITVTTGAAAFAAVNAATRPAAPPRNLFSSSPSATNAAAAAAAAAAEPPLGAVRVYQYEICPFCHKIKALLDLHRQPYETLDVNPLTKAELKPWSDYRKVPIVKLAQRGAADVDESTAEQINDSPVIAAALIDRMVEAGILSPADVTAFRSPAAVEWAKWSDEKLAVLLFPNITRSFSESFEAFKYVREVPHFSLFEKASNQLVGAFAMWMAQGKIKKKYNIDDERAAVRDAIAHWLTEGVAGRDFAGGDVPNFADVCVFGCLKAIDATAAHAEILRETDVGPWYERMLEKVQPGSSRVVRQ